MLFMKRATPIDFSYTRSPSSGMSIPAAPAGGVAREKPWPMMAAGQLGGRLAVGWLPLRIGSCVHVYELPVPRRGSKRDSMTPKNVEWQDVELGQGGTSWTTRESDLGRMRAELKAAFHPRPPADATAKRWDDPL